MIDIICATNNEEVLERNLLDSYCVKMNHVVHLQKGFTNISKAYNEAKTEGRYKIFVHQDVYLPKVFINGVTEAIKILPDDFGVIGVAGAKLVNNQRRFYGYISDRGKLWGSQQGLPKEVDTVDELLIITHGDFVFDENLDLDFYAADVCMQAKAQGRKNYAISAYCEHNSSRPMGGRTESFWRCQEYFKEKWKDFLPIATTCCILEKTTNI